MFNKNDEAMAKHVVVVFTFHDKSPIESQTEWLAELLKDHPDLISMRFVLHRMDSTKDEMLS